RVLVHTSRLAVRTWPARPGNLTFIIFVRDAAVNPDLYNQTSYDWLYFASRMGSQGNEWAIEYRGHTGIVDLSNQALELLRRGELASGKAMLEQFATSVKALPAIPCSMQAEKFQRLV